jgi:hypothetical protein
MCRSSGIWSLGRSPAHVLQSCLRRTEALRAFDYSAGIMDNFEGRASRDEVGTRLQKKICKSETARPSPFHRQDSSKKF